MVIRKRDRNSNEWDSSRGVGVLSGLCQVVRICSQHASIELAFQLMVTRIGHFICEMYRAKI